MNRKNQLEKHLLTRCYTDEEKVHEVLETRYTFTGATKPSLVLLPTGAGDSDSDKPKSLFHPESKECHSKQVQKRKVNTRIQMKKFFNDIKRNQRMVKRKLRNRDPQLVPNWQQLAHKYNIPTIEEFLPINRAWQSYMQQLVFVDVKTSDNKLPSRQTVLSKLASADFHGCLLTVLECRNKDLVGMKGIVIYDNQHSFAICVQENPERTAGIGGIRFIPKKYTLFTFDVKLPYEDVAPDREEYIPFTLIGSRFEYRSVDRSTRKFKNHNVDDIT